MSSAAPDPAPSSPTSSNAASSISYDVTSVVSGEARASTPATSKSGEVSSSSSHSRASSPSHSPSPLHSHSSSHSVSPRSFTTAGDIFSDGAPSTSSQTTSSVSSSGSISSTSSPSTSTSTPLGPLKRLQTLLFPAAAAPEEESSAADQTRNRQTKPHQAPASVSLSSVRSTASGTVISTLLRGLRSIVVSTTAVSSSAAPTSDSSEPVSPDDAHQVIVRAIPLLQASQPLPMRLDVLQVVTDVLRSSKLAKLDSVAELWTTVQDLLHRTPEAREAAFALIACIVSSQYARLGLLRWEFFRVVTAAPTNTKQPSFADQYQRLEVLSLLTHGGRDLAPFQVCDFRS